MDEFETILADVMGSITSAIPASGERFRHKKGGVYTIMGIVWDVDGHHPKPRVAYIGSGGRVFTRGLGEFLSPGRFTLVRG